MRVNDNDDPTEERCWCGATKVECNSRAAEARTRPLGAPILRTQHGYRFSSSPNAAATDADSALLDRIATILVENIQRGEWSPEADAASLEIIYEALDRAGRINKARKALQA